MKQESKQDVVKRLQESLNAQQKSVPQLPADAKPKSISVLNNKTDPEHPFAGYMVGTSESTERNELDDPRVQATIKKMQQKHGQEEAGLSKEEKLKRAQELGAKLRARGDAADKRAAKKSVAEDIANEDVLSDLKTKLGDLLLQTLGKQAVDGDLKDKTDNKNDNEVSPVVKKIKTDDGHEICIHGNEDDGFRISVKGKEGTTKFESLEHAEIASKMYCARRRNNLSERDYVDEA